MRAPIAFLASLLLLLVFLYPRNPFGKTPDFLHKATIDIRIVFGYKDARPANFVGDRYERVALIESLLKPCSGPRHDCGFQRSRTDSDLLEKEISGMDLRRHRIKLTISSSSTGPDDRENLSDPFQRWKSRKAKQVFLEGLRRADVVFYDGHSREGGGPDFNSPKLTLDGHIDYKWYRSRKPGILAMRKALRLNQHPAKVIGLFSCYSNRLKSNVSASEQIRWITYNRLIYFADALQSIKDNLSNMLGEI